MTGPAPGSADGQPSDLVRSVSRALRVLEAVGTSKNGVNAKTVARRCGLHLSTAYHLLRSLCYEGYLVRGPGGDYTLGLRIAERFHDLAATLSQPPRVTTVLRGLAGDTGHSAYLGRFVDGRVAITQVVDGPGSPHLEDLLVGFHDAAAGVRRAPPDAGRRPRPCGGAAAARVRAAGVDRTGLRPGQGPFPRQWPLTTVLVGWAGTRADRRSKMQRRGSSVLVAVLLAGVLVGCGGGDEGAPGGDTGGATEAATGEAEAASRQTLSFVAADIEYTSAPSTASAGEATVVLENQGQLEHYVVIDELGLVVEAEGGESAQGSVTLEPGTYTYYCRMPGHREAGMEGELSVS